MDERFNLLPDEQFTALRPALTERMAQVARAITPRNFPGVCTPLARDLLRDAFRHVGAQEGSVWITEEDHLVVAYNTGPNPKGIVGFRQPLNKGLISAVYASQQGVVENEVFKNQEHDRTLDDRLDQMTYAMAAVPFFFLNDCRGVISCVQLTTPAALETQVTPTGFLPNSLQIVQNAAAVWRELIDAQVLAVTVGWRQA